MVRMELENICSDRCVIPDFHSYSESFNLYQFIGSTILRRFYEAVAEAREHRKQHMEFSLTFSAESIEKWTSAIDKWNKDPAHYQPNPYEEPVLGMPSCRRSFSV